MMKSRPSMQIPQARLELAALVIILILAAVLRLGAPGITEFKRDEANLARLALDLARGRDVPLLGITSSVGIPNPPINAYLFALPYLVDDSGTAATLFVGLLNVVAVGLTWWLTRRFFGARAAAVAGLLYAAGPWAALFSRKIWAQDLLPAFVVATILTGLLGFKEGKLWAKIVHWPLLALTVQIHYGAFTLLPLSLLMLLLWQDRKQARSPRRLLSEIGVGMGIALLTGLPVLFGVCRAGLFSHDMAQKILGRGGSWSMVVDGTALDYARLLVSGAQMHALAGPDQFRSYLTTVPNAYPIFQLIPLGAVLSAVWLVWRRFGVFRTARLERSDKPAASTAEGVVSHHRVAAGGEDILLVAWLVLPILAFTWQWTPVQLHYLIPMMPAAYILFGVGFDALCRRGQSPAVRRGIIATGSVVTGVVVVLQVVMFAGLIRFLDTHFTPGGFGTPLHLLMDVRSAILEQSPADVLIVSEGEIPDYDQEPAVWSVLLDRVPDVRAVDGRRTVVVPAGDALELVLLSPTIESSPPGDYWRRSYGGEIFPQRPGDSVYLLRAVDGSSLAAQTVTVDPVRLANGAVLEGYARDGRILVLAWRLTGPTDQDYQVFAHLLDGDGNRIDQADRSSWPGCYWREGDTLYLWFELDDLPDAALVRTGMYTFDEEKIINVDILDVAGNPAGQFVDVPLD
ncbi:MAG: glycosyltransferase family 39 protein [Anaerolineae bacterium]|nr:glycosyltransferase family 39 protein [Anaerolineae bacterium]